MTFISGLLPIAQVILSIVLIALILLQRSDEGVGGAFGGDGIDGSRFKRRGAERVIFQSTIVVAILFALTSFLALIIS